MAKQACMHSACPESKRSCCGGNLHHLVDIKIIDIKIHIPAVNVNGAVGQPLYSKARKWSPPTFVRGCVGVRAARPPMCCLRALRQTHTHPPTRARKPPVLRRPSIGKQGSWL